MARVEAGEEAAGAASRRGEEPVDAIALLTRDHREVEALFKRFQDSDDENEKSALAEQVCLALRIHAQIEEEIFYPAARRRVEDTDLVDEALVEHASVKRLIADIEETEAGDPMLDARLQVLSEQVGHHVHEEETELFPEMRQADIDLTGLGGRLAKRKAELLAEALRDDDALAPEPRAFADEG